MRRRSVEARRLLARSAADPAGSGYRRSRRVDRRGRGGHRKASTRRWRRRLEQLRKATRRWTRRWTSTCRSRASRRCASTPSRSASPSRSRSLLRAFVVEAFQIPSGSMIPTLEIGDHIFVSKFAYGLGDSLHRQEDPAVRRSPSAVTSSSSSTRRTTSTDYIKRVVGLPGDTVEVRQRRALHQRPADAARAGDRAVRLQRTRRRGVRRHDCELLGRDARRRGPRHDPGAVDRGPTTCPRR